MSIRPLKRSDTTLSDDTELANVTYNDKYVIVYDFGNVGTLCHKGVVLERTADED